MGFARLAKYRSTCLRRKVGAVIVKDRMILATGYNGAPKGTAHCKDLGCIRELQGIPSGQRHELCRGAHAEQNAIAQAACHGVRVFGATMYCTAFPCIMCVKSIINSGIRRVYFSDRYGDGVTASMASKLCQESGVDLISAVDLGYYFLED